jgi:hypothetical protein
VQTVLNLIGVLQFRSVKWTRPLCRYVKLNVNAAFEADIQAGATAAVIQDSRGKFIAVSCAYIQHVDSVASTEAIAT